MFNLRSVLAIGSAVSSMAMAQTAERRISILDASSSAYNREVNWLLWIVGIFALLVFLGVTVALIYTVVKYKKTGKETSEPPQFHGNDALEIWLTIIPTIIVLIIFGVTAKSMFKLSKPPANPLVINVTGYQFWWDFVYEASGVRTANEVVVPVGKPVAFVITGSDVVHSFRIASMIGTKDAIPGKKSTIYVTPEKEGDYYGQCVELCGPSHSRMRFNVKVVSEERYQQYIKALESTSVKRLSSVHAKGHELFVTNCAGCHSIQGKPNVAQAKYPELNGFGSHAKLAAGLLNNTDAALTAWIKDSAAVKPGSQMPAFKQLSDAQLKDLVAYVRSQTLEGVDFSDLKKY